MLHKRAAPGLFDDGVADILVEYSGGHPRDLLRLLHGTFIYTEHGRFDKASARRAVREAATDFRRFLVPEDYRLLAKIDSEPSPPTGSERTRNLLYNLALLEYNNFYCRSHPVIRTTDAYEGSSKSAHRRPRWMKRPQSGHFARSTPALSFGFSGCWRAGSRLRCAS